MILKRLRLICFLCCILIQLQLEADTLLLRENLKTAKAGDYLVTLQNKTFTLYLISKMENESTFIEEVSIPAANFRAQNCSFRSWFEASSPRHSSFVMYQIDLRNGQILKSYILSQGSWFEKPMANSFLSTLFNLKFNEVPPSERKKIGRGARGSSPYWQPKLIFENQWVQNVPFYAFRTKWPNDKSDLAGKTIEIYTPEESELYPSYLPYWLEISGIVGNAKIRIVDSGRNLSANLKSIKSDQ